MQASVLVLALLATESSYKSAIERPAGRLADTVQFWLGSQGPWRIRTYAIDHDIHIHSLGTAPVEPDFAQAHITKHFGDALDRQHVLSFADPADAEAVRRVLDQHGLSGTLEVAPAGFAFYNPDGNKYRTQSEPK